MSVTERATTQQEQSYLKGRNDMQLNSSPCTVYYFNFGANANAVQIILGGSWLSKISLGESGRYLLSSFKEKIFEPLMQRVAERIYQNEMAMRTLF